MRRRDRRRCDVAGRPRRGRRAARPMLSWAVCSVAVGSTRMTSRGRVVPVSIFRGPVPGRPYVPRAEPGPTPFVILTMPRSGSSTLVKRLDAHPRIECHGEALHSRRVYAKFARREGWTVDRRNADRAAFLRRLYEQPASNHTLAVGAKLFATHLSEAEFATFVLSTAVRKVVLRRALPSVPGGGRAARVVAWCVWGDTRRDASSTRGVALRTTLGETPCRQRQKCNPRLSFFPRSRARRSFSRRRRRPR